MGALPQGTIKALGRSASGGIPSAGCNVGRLHQQLEVWVLPTIPGIGGPYRIFFYSFDCNLPRQVHVRRDQAASKFWLEPVALASNNGFSAKELYRIRKIILDNLDHIREAWDEHCGQ